MSIDIKNIEVNVRVRFMPLAFEAKDRMVYAMTSHIRESILFPAISVDYYEVCQYTLPAFEIVSERYE